MNQLQQDLLKDVSRSFYLSFWILPKKVRPVMSVGYLLCRAADTIADTPSISLEEKQKFLRTFKNLFSNFPIPSELLNSFLKELDPSNLSIKPNEKKLLKNFGECAAWFNALTRTQQSLIQSVVTAVITGMEMDLNVFGSPEAPPVDKQGKPTKTDAKESPIAVHALQNESDLETYIRCIGGEPGRFWTSVCLSDVSILKIPSPDQLLHDGIVFGTGLQMVNILRDLPEDLKMGRCYLPQELLEKHRLTLEDLTTGNKEDIFRTLYIDLIDQTMFRLERGMSYILQLPRKSVGLRAAVWWPMMIGVMTLKRLREAPSVLKAKNRIKVTRREIYTLILGTFWMLPFDALLKKHFEKSA